MKNYMKKALSLLLTVILTTMLFSGCSKTEDKDTQATGAADTTSTEAIKTVEPVADPMAKYDPEITVTSYFEIAPPLASYFSEERINTNIFAKKYAEELGIKVDYLWYAAQSPEDSVQKKSIAIASGEIPDIMQVSKEQLALLAQSDLINKEIGTIYDQYASEHLKAWTTGEGSAALESATYDGKVIAIPCVDSSIDTSPFLWLRKDWLEKLGLEVPKTMDDLYQVMKAFKEQDPDGDGKADTIGLILCKDFLTLGAADGLGLFNGFGSYPQAWIDDGTGKLVYGSTQPQTKEALAFLAKLYAEGLIEEDFSVKDINKASEVSASGTGGVQYGAMWNAMWPLQSTLDNDANANWVPVPVVSATAEPAKPQIHLNVPYYYVVSKEAKNPEALIKMLNFFVEKFSYVPTEEYNQYLVTDTGIPSFALHDVMFKTYNPLKNLQAYWDVKDAFANNDTSKLNAEELSYYDSIVKSRGGDKSMAGSEKTFGDKDSAFAAMDYYYQNKLFMMDAYNGAPTETMKQKLQLIKDKEMEYFTKVIMGVDTVDSFDAFVKEVNKLGLEEITTEVNEWYTSK